MISSKRDGLLLSCLLLHLEKVTRRWDGSAGDRKYIERNTLQKLKEIWNSSGRSVFLLPLVFYFVITTKFETKR